MQETINNQTSPSSEGSTSTEPIFHALIKGEDKELTNDIKVAGIYIKEIKFFAGLAFEKSPHILEEFGIGKYRYNKITETTLIEWMQIIHITCQKYEAELVKSGMNTKLITDIGKNITKLIIDNNKNLS
jgi:hypothetical protein